MQIKGDELQREYDYMIAEHMTKELLDAGLITEEEYKVIQRESIKVFKPLLYPLMLDE